MRRRGKAHALGAWDYWAKHPTTGPRAIYRWNPRNAHPGVMAELESEPDREEWVRTMVLLARRQARDTVAREIEQGCWWVPAGFTVADLDAKIAEVY